MVMALPPDTSRGSVAAASPAALASAASMACVSRVNSSGADRWSRNEPSHVIGRRHSGTSSLMSRAPRSVASWSRRRPRSPPVTLKVRSVVRISTSVVR
jgi:hypothetical protein